ncbi:hypothetical protein D0T84_21510 [Dysgonomonas sp. 521]|uniref:hypothetical protein n=1 Tax=Dysgonomonas sp. 521 TaxID=2302932 RepID=UPI0013D7B6F5|nr:hypothetical protein [Dysgonomonas sp. 521]NDV97450.1 hypothetical protein [Dysgonomonas sp. 521]
MTGQERNQFLFVADAIRQIFGINSPLYIPYGENKDFEPGEYNDIKFLRPDTELMEDMNIPPTEFGTKVYGAIQFEGGGYNMYERDGSLVEERFGDYTLPYSCIASFSRDSNITKTEVLGQREP